MVETIEVAKSPVQKPASNRFWLGFVLGALAAAVVFAAVTAIRSPSLSSTVFLMRNKANKGVVQTASGLQYQVLTQGKGAKPTDTDVTLVNYEGKLLDGTTFDKSQQPTPMPVSGVVPGFAEALKLMPKGAKYRFWIKPELGYGDKASGPIPANSVLVFDVELLDFLPESVIRQMQAQQQMQMMQQGAGKDAPSGSAAPPTK